MSEEYVGTYALYCDVSIIVILDITHNVFDFTLFIMIVDLY